jgi:trans-aconitate methyltransferase
MTVHRHDQQDPHDKHDHHGHDRPRGDDELWTSWGDRLERQAEVEMVWVRDAARWLADLRGGAPRAVIDAGSGPGVTACALAQTFPGAAVTALDTTREFLDRTTHRAARLGVADRVQTWEADLHDALTRSPGADLVWAARVVHHLPDPVQGLRGLGGLLGDDGLLAVVEGGLPMRSLPGGYGVGSPATLQRIEAHLSDFAVEAFGLSSAAMHGARDWPLLIEDAGLRHVRSRTFLLDLPAPVDDAVRWVVDAHWREASDRLTDRLSAEERAALDVLLDPSDPRSLRSRPDLFLLAASTVHVAARG